MTDKKTRTEASSTVNPALYNIVAPLGLLLILAATAVPFFMMHTPWAQQAYPFVYGAGALVLLAARLFARKGRCSDMRLERLYRLEKWAPVIFIVALGLLFYNPHTLRDWLAFTMAGAVIQLYTSLAIPAREKKISGK